MRLPPFPVDDLTLNAVEHALGGCWTSGVDGEVVLIGAEHTLDQLLDFMAGIDHGDDENHVRQVDDHVFVDDRQHYTTHDIILSLIAEVRTLRGHEPR